MKRIIFIIVCFLFSRCAKDNIVYVDPVDHSDDNGDYIENTVFSRTVTVTFHPDADAMVSGLTENVTASIDGNGVTITNAGTEYIQYELSGSTNDGFFKVYSAAKHAIVLNDLTLTNASGIAIDAQSKRTFIVVNGNNALAAVYSVGQLIFSGTGNLTVDAPGENGIASDYYVRVMEGPTIEVNAKTGYGISSEGYILFDGGDTRITASGNDGVKVEANFFMNGGRLTVNSSGKGISCAGNAYFNGGAVVVNSSSDEGIEAKGTIDVCAGEVYSYSAADDAINSGGDFSITGGAVYAYAPKNDGLDANGDCYVKGGLVYAIGATSPEVGIDANSEENHKLYVEGGTLFVIGGLESGASLTQSCYSTSSWSKNTWYAMSVNEITYAFKTPESGGSVLIVSGAVAPTLLSGVTVVDGDACFEGLCYQNASVSGGTLVSLSSYSGGNGGGGPGGGGPGGPGGPGWMTF